MAKNPYELTLLRASKQALVMLSEVGKIFGESISEMAPAMQLLRAISDYEKWEKEHAANPTDRSA